MGKKNTCSAFINLVIPICLRHPPRPSPAQPPPQASNSSTFLLSNTLSYRKACSHRGQHNGGRLLGCQQDCRCEHMCKSIRMYNGSDSWPVVNVCNKAEQPKWWKTPGVRLGRVLRRRQHECMCVRVYVYHCAIEWDQNSRWEGRLILGVKSVWGECVWKWNRAGVRLGVYTPK